MIYLSLEELVAQMRPEQGAYCQKFLETHAELLKTAPGSTHNHQAWEGGFLDHLRETGNIACVLYGALSACRKLPFGIEDALPVLWFHDGEKPWRIGRREDGTYYSIVPKSEGDRIRLEKIAENGIEFTPEQWNALKYVEGEKGEYTQGKRMMGELAAFCHLCDVTSARIWWDQPRQDGW